MVQTRYGYLKSVLMPKRQKRRKKWNHLLIRPPLQRTGWKPMNGTMFGGSTLKKRIALGFLSSVTQSPVVIVRW